MKKCLLCNEKIKENHLLCLDHYNEIKEKYPFIENLELEELKLFMNLYIKANPKDKLPDFQCEDGHYVRSTHEQLIDNFLYNNNIRHAYEQKIEDKNKKEGYILCDWYLPDGNVYIEYWGMENNTMYEEQKNYKLKIYKNFNLIQLYPEDTKKDLRFKLKQELAKYNIEIK